MLDPKKIAELEQGMALLTEVYPRMCWNLYVAMQENGFTKQEAFVLVQTYLLSQGSGCVLFPQQPPTKE
jgi:hypothetical protein